MMGHGKDATPHVTHVDCEVRRHYSDGHVEREYLDISDMQVSVSGCDAPEISLTGSYKGASVQEAAMMKNEEKLKEVIECVLLGFICGCVGAAVALILRGPML